MFKYPPKRNGYNFHVVMRMRAKTHSLGNPIVVPHPEAAKVNSIGVVPIGKRKRVIGLEPSVIGMAPLRRRMKQCFQCCNFNFSDKKPDAMSGMYKVRNNLYGCPLSLPRFAPCRDDDPQPPHWTFSWLFPQTFSLYRFWPFPFRLCRGTMPRFWKYLQSCTKEPKLPLISGSKKG